MHPVLPHGLKTTTLIVFGALLAFEAQAQQPAPSQVTPPTLRPQPLTGGVIVGAPDGAPVRAPAEAAQLNVKISHVRIEGAFAEVEGDAKRLVGKFEGRRVTVAQLYEIASLIERIHLEAGYVLARVVVPPQQIVDGSSFRLVVIDGFIEAIEADGVPDRVRPEIEARTRALIGQRHITIAEIERRLLLAGDVPGVRLKSTLARGRTAGGTRLILEAVYKPIQGTVTADNRLSPPLGHRQYGTSLSANSLLGWGEQVYGTVAAGGDLDDIFAGRSRLKLYGVGAVIPIGRDGLTLNPEYTVTLTNPTPIQGVLATEDRFERWAARLLYPAIRSRSSNLVAQIGYERIQQTSEAIDFAILINKDAYHVMRGGFQSDVTTAWGATLVTSVSFSSGLGGRDATAAAASGVPLSRLGAGPNFQKLQAEAHLSQFFAEGTFRWQVSLRGQHSFSEALLKSEQFALDSSDLLTGWPGGSFAVDQGLSFRAELARPINLSQAGWLKVVSPYAFVGTARGQIFNPTAVEQSALSATSYGIGMRGNTETATTAQGAVLSVEFARRFTDDPNKPEGYRVTTSLGVKF